jgi:hypothetical protein
MTKDIYGAVVPSWLQMLDALTAIMDKAEIHCAEQGVTEQSVLDSKLAEDMFPLAYQIKSAAVHSAGAIEGVRAGTFSPDLSTPPTSFAEGKARLIAARETVAAIDPAELNALVGRDMVFAFGQFRREFVVEGFLQSFSLPNFFFHVTTAYALLRAAGVPLGKRDYMGQMQLKA